MVGIVDDLCSSEIGALALDATARLGDVFPSCDC
jgi:hypothetical protein